MTRSVEEWIGHTDDSRIPTRVRLRVFEATGGRCAECGAKLGVGGHGFDIDHTKALVNGGEHRESNLRALCRPCHKVKTREDVAMKSKDRRVKAKHLGQNETANPLPCGRSGKASYGGTKRTTPRTRTSRRRK